MNNDEREQPGAYILTHESTAAFYIGSTDDLHRRLRKHNSKLALGTHESKKLQQFYDHDDEFSVETFPVANKEEALNKEQALLDQHHGSPFCLNVAKDARSPAKGLLKSEEWRAKIGQAHKGKVLSQETRDKVSQSKKGMVPSEEALKAWRAAAERGGADVLIQGTEYPSVREAARQLNLPLSTVRQRLSSNSEQFSDWKKK